MREIAKQNAALVRDRFKKEKNKEIKSLKEQHQSSRDVANEEKLSEMKLMVESHIGNIGQGHVNAQNYVNIQIYFSLIYY